eukprot:COSAG02_NODE_888_length_16167_cov_293.783234_8_plen_157_part_00
MRENRGQETEKDKGMDEEDRHSSVLTKGLNRRHEETASKKEPAKKRFKLKANAATFQFNPSAAAFQPGGTSFQVEGKGKEGKGGAGEIFFSSCPALITDQSLPVPPGVPHNSLSLELCCAKGREARGAGEIFSLAPHTTHCRTSACLLSKGKWRRW